MKVTDPRKTTPGGEFRFLAWAIGLGVALLFLTLLCKGFKP